jgi:hypothetical protein
MCVKEVWIARMWTEGGGRTAPRVTRSPLSDGGGVGRGAAGGLEAKMGGIRSPPKRTLLAAAPAVGLQRDRSWSSVEQCGG